MANSPYAKALASVNGAGYTSGGLTATLGATVQLLAESTAGWNNQRWEIYEHPPGYPQPTGWSTDAGGNYYTTTLNPPSFALSIWGKYLVRLTVNGGLLNGALAPFGSSQPMIDEGTALRVASTHGLHDVGLQEHNQFDPVLLNYADLKANLRTIDTQLGGGGGGGAGSAKVTTPEANGAVGNGSTNDATALAAALATIPATNGALQLGATTYACQSMLTVPIAAQVTGWGDTTILTTNANTTLLRLAVGAEDVEIRGLKLVGNSTGTSQHGIECGRDGVAGTGIGRARFIDLTIENMGQYGLACSGAAATGILFYGPHIQDCNIRGCVTGLLITQAAEYIKMVNGNINNCTLGMWIGAGNFHASGVNVTGNTTGVRVSQSLNDAHGMMSGCHINHNTTAIYIDTLTQAFTFNACHVYDGTIVANGNARIVQFEGGELDPSNITNNSGKLRFVGCLFPGDYFVSCTETGTGWTEFVDCRGATGVTQAFINSRVNRLWAFPSDANATLSWQDSVAQTLIVQNGVTTATRTITSPWAPGDGRTMRVTNQNAQAVTFAWASGTGVTIPSVSWALIAGSAGNAIILEAGALGITPPPPVGAPYNPAVLSLSAWERIAYSSAPWPGTASAGGSGSVSFATTTGSSAPSTGTALNGFATVDFNGTSQSLTYTGAALNVMLSTTAYTYSVLVYPRGGAAASSPAYNDQQIIGDQGAVFGLCWSTSGVRAFHDASGVVATGWVACSANAWHWIDVKYDGTNLKIRVDGGAWTSVAAANPTSFGSTWFRLGRNYGSQYTSMQLAEFITAPSALADATLDSLRASYADTRYGLSL